MEKRLETEKIWRSVLFSCLYFALAAAEALAPLKNTGPRPELSSFTRIISQATLHDYDIGRVVAWLLVWLVGSVALFCMLLKLGSLFAAAVVRQAPERIVYIKGLNLLALMGLPILVIQLLNLFEGFSYNWLMQVIFIFAILSLGWLYIAIGHVSRLPLLPEASLAWAATAALGPCFPLALVAGRVLGSGSPMLLLLAYLGCLVAIVCLLTLLQARARRPFGEVQQGLAGAALPLMLGPALTSIYIELRNILTQYGIALRAPYRDIALLYAALLAVGVLLWWRKRLLRNWERAYFPLAVAGLLLLSVQPYFINPTEPSFFESANLTLPVTQFFAYGHVPVVESFSAHMLSDFLPNALYSLLNRDPMGAFILTYRAYEALVPLLVYYTLLGRLFGRRFAFLFVVLFPFMDKAFGPLTLAAVCILALCLVVKRPGWKSYALYALVLAGCCLHQLDAGVAYGFGTLMALVVVRAVCAGRGAKIRLWAVFAWLAGVGTALLGAFAAICLAKGIPFLPRLREFLEICASSANWAYNFIGNVTLTSYVWYYVLVPVAVLSLCVAVVAKSRRCPTWLTPTCFAALLALGLTFMVNLPRSIVRHNLVEGAMGNLLYTAPLFIALAAALLYGRHRRTVFIALLLCGGMASHSMLTLSSTKAASLAGNMVNRYTYGLVQEELPLGVSRVDLTDTLDEYAPVLDALTGLLEPGESFVDLANSTALYSMLGLESPVYVNQSPALLSGEFTQQQFIGQIAARRESLPVVLTGAEHEELPVMLDGVYNSTRYFLIYEYLYENYTPLAACDTFLLWADRDKAESLRQKAEALGLAAWSDVDIGYMMGKKQELYDLPWMWANKDAKNAAQSPVLQQLAPDAAGRYPLAEATAGPAYLLLELHAEAQQRVEVVLYGGDGTALNSLAFTARPGAHTYLLRPSGGYYWSEGAVAAVGVEPEQAVSVARLEVLQGD